MTNRPSRWLLAISALIMAAPAAAQTTGTTAGATGGSTATVVSTSPGTGSTAAGTTRATTTDSTATGGSSTTGAFERLSPGNQKIARSLFEAQQPTTTGPAPLSLNQIAALKAGNGGEDGTGWGNVFKQMKSEGLVDAKNLGQVVSGHAAKPVAAAATPKPVVVTTGSGRVLAQRSVSQSAHDGGGRYADAGSGRGKGDASNGDGTVVTTAAGAAGTGGVYTGNGAGHGGGATNSGGGGSNGGGRGHVR
jgi:hypothetical protein